MVHSIKLWQVTILFVLVGAVWAGDDPATATKHIPRPFPWYPTPPENYDNLIDLLNESNLGDVIDKKKPQYEI